MNCHEHRLFARIMSAKYLNQPFSKGCDDLIISLISIFPRCVEIEDFVRVFIISESYFSRCTLEHLRKGNSTTAVHTREAWEVLLFSFLSFSLLLFYVIPSFHCIKNKANGCRCKTCLRKIATSEKNLKNWRLEQRVRRRITSGIWIISPIRVNTFVHETETILSSDNANIRVNLEGISAVCKLKVNY